MSLSNYLENAVLNKVLRNEDFTVPTPYVALHVADPGETGANEVSGNGYTRQEGSFASASGGVSDSDTVVAFPDMPAVTVTHASVWDAENGGNVLVSGKLKDQVALNEGDTFRFSVAALTMTLE